MLQWFSRTAKSSPSYSLLRAVPSRGLPQDLADLADREASSDYQQWRDRIECDLAAQGCDEDEPNFLTFLNCGNGLRMCLPQLEGGCLFAFTTPLRAADYASVAAPKQIFAYFCSSPKQVVFGVNEFRERAGVRYIALDRCPRCDVFTTVDASNFDNAAKVIKLRNISKATEIARRSVRCLDQDSGADGCRSRYRKDRQLVVRESCSNPVRRPMREHSQRRLCSWH
jgi:hypothetical protein